jgi:Protein of unknown function (DUF3800)
MYLVYLDESGNSGLNLNDPQQPFFLLCAMLVAEEQWQPLEVDLQKILAARFPNWKSIEDFEVHAVDLRSGRGPFVNISVADRIAFRDAWMQTGVKHGVRLIFSSVDKKRYSDWLLKNFGQGVVINPYVAAFAVLSRRINNYLNSLPGSPLGILIMDENHEIVQDIEKSIAVFRGDTGTLRLSKIVEKGFFIQSHKSLPLQLCDLFALSLRKDVELRLSKDAVQNPKPIDASGIALAMSLVHSDTEYPEDVYEWLKKHGNERKKEAARGYTQGR